MSIPASFESNQRQDLLEALKANGIEISGHNLIDEPNAAFLGYLHEDEYYKEHIEVPENYNPKVLVFDFGAGTCDISILELGVDYKGFNTRNISISQFTELGGNDIDRHIAENYLLPDLLDHNNMDRNHFTQSNIQKIVNQLMGAAEMLKIQASKVFDYLMADPKTLKQMADAGDCISITTPVCIETGYGDLRQSEFTLKYSQFQDTMKKFYSPISFMGRVLKRDNACIETVIESAIVKAQIKKTEVDYVMMVGGSSRNPVVRTELKGSFGKRTAMLAPKNMQTLVSQGAAIHSLLINGLDLTAVKPITSEPIVVVVRGEEEMPLIAAGTEIPFSPITVDNFTTGDNSQSTLEIPICVSNAKKVLSTIKITNPGGKPFPKNEKIALTLAMSADKVLSVKARCGDLECEATTENPFANTYLTDADKRILAAQRDSNISASNNDGIPTLQALRDLRQAYHEAGKDFMAAETLVDEVEYYPSDENYNYIGVLYWNGGDKRKAIEYFSKAVKVNPCDYYAWGNLGNVFWSLGKNNLAKDALGRAIDVKPDYPMALIVLGRIHNEEGEGDQAKTLWEQAFILLNRRYKDDNMSQVDYSWFISVAEALGYYDIAQEARARAPKKHKSQAYNADNLITTVKREKPCI